MSEWRLIDSAPKGPKILAGFWNDLGNWRTITARYYREFELDDHTGETEDGFAPEGWYEEYESNEEIYQVSRPLTHWQPLPSPPARLS